MTTSAPACAVHVTEPAIATCNRCGAFACTNCERERADGLRLCVACWPAHRYLPLPIDTSRSPRAFLSTLALWLFRPRRSRSLYSPQGSKLDSVLVIAVSAASVYIAASILGEVAEMRSWSSGTAPAPVQLVADLGAWLQTYFFFQVFVAGVTLAIDRLILWRSTTNARLLRAWAFTLAPVWTMWLAVVLVLAGVALFSPAPSWRGTVALLLTLAGTSGVPLSILLWTLWRWWLFAWASESTARSRVAAAWPLSVMVLLAVLVAAA